MNPVRVDNGISILEGYSGGQGNANPPAVIVPFVVGVGASVPKVVKMEITLI